MAQRYVFYRMPTGKPYRGQDGKHAPAHLLARIGAASVLTADRTIAWPQFFMERLQIALRSACVVMNPSEYELNDHDAWEIVWRALATVVEKAPGQPIKPGDLLKAADAVAAAFFRKAPAQFVLVTSLSIADLPVRTIAVRDCRLAPLRSRARFPLPPPLADHPPAAFADHLSSTRYQLVKVTTEGRSIFEAAETALTTLHLLRGIWSLIATRGSWRMTIGGLGKGPLGVIHTGPVHTLHLADGSPAADGLYWFDPDYTEEQDLFAWGNRRGRIEKDRRTLMRRLGSLPYRHDLEDLLVRYAVALDQPDPNKAFLQMWGILEKMTDTVGANYDETIKRSIWAYRNEDRPLTKDILESLRYRRNRYVHAGSEGQEADQVAYLMKSVVDPHLLRLVLNPFQVRSLEEYGQFLSLPTDERALEQQRRRLGRALRAIRGQRPAT